MTPNPDGVRLAKEWASVQYQPVTVKGYPQSKVGGTLHYTFEGGAEWLTLPSFFCPFPSEQEAWQFLAEVIASVRPVVEAEALERAAKVAETDQGCQCSGLRTILQPCPGCQMTDYGHVVATRIRSLIPPVTP